MLMLNQPFNGQLGDILTDKMQQPYNRFVFFSAFAKNSGVLRLKPAMEQFKANGGRIFPLLSELMHMEHRTKQF